MKSSADFRIDASKTDEESLSPPASPTWNPAFPVFVIPMLLSLAVVAAFGNSFYGVFVFDDHGAIEDNLSIRNLFDPWTIFTRATQCTVVGRPLLNLSLAVDYHLYGEHPAWYHLTNVVCHAVAGIVLFSWLRGTFALEKKSRVSQVEATRIAFIVTMLWIVHPLHVGSVTYIVQRAECIMGLLYLTSLYAVLRSVTDSPDREKIWWGIAILACYLGAMTKEVIATLPVICLLYDRTYLAGSFRGALQRRKPLYVGLATVWLPIGWLVLTSRNRAGSAGFGLGVTPWEYAWTQTWFLTHYLRSSVWPDSLLFDPGETIIHSIPTLLPFACLICALLAATLIALCRRPILGFWASWFFIILSPTSSFVPLAGQTGAEHRMYLPLVGVVVLLVLVIDALCQWYGLRSGSLPSKKPVDVHSIRTVFNGGLAAALVVACLFVAVTRARNKLFQDELLIWLDVVKKAPNNARGFNACGTSLYIRGDYPMAIAAYDRALAINPRLVIAMFNRGRTLVEMGRIDEGIDQLTRAVQSSPDDVLGLLLLCRAYGALAALTEDKSLAEDALNGIARLEATVPGWPRLRLERGVIKAAFQRDAEALEDWDAILKLNPRYTEVFFERARFYIRRRRYNDAMIELGRAIEQTPHLPRYYLERAKVHSLRCDEAAAKDDLAKARSLEIVVPRNAFGPKPPTDRI